MKSAPVFCDIESEQLYVNMSTIQMKALGEEPQLIRTDTDDEVENIKVMIKPFHTVWWNAAYDLGTLNMVTAKVDDLFYAVKIAYPQIQNFKLDNVVKFLGFDYLYEGIDKKEMQKKGFVRKAYLSKAQMKYAIADVEALELIWRDEKVQYVIQNNLAYRLGMYALVEAIQWQQNGLPILHEVVERYMAETKADIEQYQALLPIGLNPRSPKQVKELFGTESSDKPTLIRLAVNHNNKMAEQVLDARKAMNDLSKLNRYIYDKMVGRFNPMGAATSRWSCKGGDLSNGINMQNYPRQFKGVFGIPEDSGQIIVSADYATLEIRIACAIMGETHMYNALKAGKDIHKSTASLIYNKPLDRIEGRERSNAKVANFGFLYGMSAVTFVEYAFDLYGLKFTLKEAQQLRAKWFKAYPDVQRYHDKVGSGLRKHNLIVETALGYKIKPKMYTDAINAATQGTGGEVGRLAIHIMVKKDKRTLQNLRNFIHDSFYLIVPEYEADYWGKLLEESMLEAWHEISKSRLFKWHDIPMMADVVYGHSMSELHDEFEGGGQALNMKEMREELAKRGETL